MTTLTLIQYVEKVNALVHPDGPTRWGADEANEIKTKLNSAITALQARIDEDRVQPVTATGPNVAFNYALGKVLVVTASIDIDVAAPAGMTESKQAIVEVVNAHVTNSITATVTGLLQQDGNAYSGMVVGPGAIATMQIHKQTGGALLLLSSPDPVAAANYDLTAQSVVSGTPSVVSHTAHGLVVGEQIQFDPTTAFYALAQTEIEAATLPLVVATQGFGANSFELAQGDPGTALNLTGGINELNVKYRSLGPIVI